MKLHDMAARLHITERSAHGIVNDLTVAGYISKHKDESRNRDQIVAHQSLPEPITREKSFGKFLPCSQALPLASHRRKGDTAEPRRFARPVKG
jgi:hypothetical protein